MIKIALIFVVLTIAQSNTAFWSSAPTNTKVMVSNRHSVATQIYKGSSSLPSLPSGAQWIHQKDSHQWPEKSQIQYRMMFDAYCVGPATLTVASTTPFKVRIFGKQLGGSQKGNQTLVFNFNMYCRQYVKLIVTATNRHNGLQSAIAYQVAQDQSRCQCDDPKGFYNRKTCRCECIHRHRCNNIRKMKNWIDYPVCGCFCRTKKRSCNPVTHYFDQQLCRCACRLRVCGKGQRQDRKTCKCKR